MKRAAWQSVLALACALLSACAAHDSAFAERAAVANAAGAAREFLDSLPPARRVEASAAIGDPSRLKWGFVPAQYPGVMWGDLEERQRELLRALLRAAMSEVGVRTVLSVMEWEGILRELESAQGVDARHRDPQRYWVQFFGEPSARGAWAFRMQGHHVSLHVAFADGAACGFTPMFLGANPHRIPSGPRAGERLLGEEEDLARELLASLDEAQRKAAIVSEVAPPDIVLGPQRHAEDAGPARGLFAAQMNDAQRWLLQRWVERFVRREAAPFADADMRRIRDAGIERIAFSWMGGTKTGQGHYCRAQGPTFVIEYDNTQNGANHAHAVYRDFERDFGGDPLRAHYEQAHAIPRSDF